MHPLRDTIALRVVRCRVEQGYVPLITELLELLTGELSSVVQDYGPWCPVVGDILPRSVYDVCVVCFVLKGKNLTNLL